MFTTKSGSVTFLRNALYFNSYLCVTEYAYASGFNSVSKN